jgi:cell wall-associated NlpC family hydrolase
VATTSGASSRARRTAARAAASVAVAALVFGGLLGTGTTASAQPKATISQVEAQVEALQQDAADAAEKWDGAVTELHAIQGKISSLNVRIKVAQAQYAAVAGAVNAMARAAYASGGIDPSLQALLADNPQQFLDQTAALDQVARAQGTSMRRTAAARLALAQLQVQLAQQQAAAKSATSAAKAAKLEVDQKLAAAEALLGSLKAAERKKLEAAMAAKRAHSEALARAAQAAAAQAAASATHHRKSNGGGSGSSNGGGSSYSGGSSGSGGSPSSRARIAVAYALSKVGDSYVAGAAGPRAFDCSGLTMAAYRSAGISLPHYSYSQYDVTQRVSRGDLRPGDLVFYFGYGSHHVAMYIGGGMMVSASNPSAGVQIIGVWSAWYSERYSGAGRVV